MKSGVVNEKIIDYLGRSMCVDLKNHNKIVGTLVFYHLTEQMIHLMNWQEFNSVGELVRQGKFMVVNRTAWFQIYNEEENETETDSYTE